MRFTRLASMIVVLALACLALPTRAAGEEPEEEYRYDGYHLVQAVPTSWDQIEKLHDLGAILVSCHEGLGPVDYAIPSESVSALSRMQITFSVKHKDLQQLIDTERERLSRAGDVDLRDGAWFDDYKPLDQINAKLQQMVADRPDLCSLIDIGDSIEGRDIWALRITGPGADKPAVLFNGTQHAREWISPMMNMYIADVLVYEYDTDPTIQSLVDQVEFFIVPVVNPDGYVYTWGPDRLWRKNRRINEGSGCIGVDLNRNWDANHGGAGASPDPCDLEFHGPSAFSEPETAAMRDFYEAHPNIVSNIDYHSYSELILWPYGYSSGLCVDHETFADVGNGMQAEILDVHGVFYEAGPLYWTIYPVSGGGIDWAYDTEDVFAFTVELRPKTDWAGGFQLPPDQIIPTCEENLPAALYLAEWSTKPVYFTFPGDLPSVINAGAETVVPTTIRIFAGAPIDAGSEKLFYRIGDGSFTERALTHLGGADYEGMLPAAACGQTVEYYFQVQKAGGELYRSPQDAPALVYEADVIEIPYHWNMDTDPGWDTEGLWEWGQPTGEGGEGVVGEKDPDRGYTGSNVYGYNLTGDYEDSLPERHLTSGALDCTGLSDVTLRFYRWLNVENAPYDNAYLRVSNDGVSWTTIWANSDEITDTSWSLQEFDISDVADDQATVYLRWTMGETDFALGYSGWNIDDVEIRATCEGGGVPGDIDGDGDVDLQDLATLLAGYGKCTGELGYNPDADFNNDGCVDLSDLSALLGNYGT